MRYTSKQYAFALNSALKEKTSQERDVILNNFISILRKQKDFKKISFIERELENIYLKENDLIKAEIISPHPVSESTIQKIKNFIASFLKHPSNFIFLNSKIDSSLIGGVQIRVKDYLIDGSVKNILLKLNKYAK